MRADKPVLMSTHGPNSARNALRSLVHPIRLQPIKPELNAAGLSHLNEAYVWAFKNLSNVIRNPDPLRAGDLCVTTQRAADGSSVVVRRLFPVLGVMFRAPALAPRLSINWSGDGWHNLVLLDEPLVLSPPVPFPDLDAQFDVRPGAMFTSKFLHPSVDELLDWLGALPVPNASATAGKPLPTNPVTTVQPSSAESGGRRRLGVVQFRREVAGAYGTACAACGFDPGFFTAAHLKDWAKRGPDEWWNGLPLCPNHHVLFDRGRIRVDPQSLQWVAHDNVSLTDLGVALRDLSGLASKPLPEMLQWKWEHPIAGR